MNREIYPNNTFGSSGDIGTATDGTLEVIGLLRIPISDSDLSDGNVLTYVASDAKFETKPVNNRKVTVNALGMTDDWLVDTNQPSVFTVNALQGTRSWLTNKSILVNMFSVSEDYNISVNAVKAITVNGA